MLTKVKKAMYEQSENSTSNRKYKQVPSRKYRAVEYSNWNEVPCCYHFAISPFRSVNI